MPNYLFLFFLLLFSMTVDAQNIYSALHHNENREYKFGKPSEIRETNTFYSPHTQVEKNIKVFDGSGMLSVETRYDETGGLKAKLTYLNDTVRHLSLQRIMERWTNIGYTKETSIYSYDSQNFLVRIVDVDAKDNIITISEIVNNNKGNPTDLHLYDGSGRPYGVENAEYFYEKNMAVTSILSKDGRKLSTDTLKINFNMDRDSLSYSSKNPDGSKTLFEVEYIYDGIGNRIDEKIYKVTVKRNGKKKRDLDRHFQKQIVYRKE